MPQNNPTTRRNNKPTSGSAFIKVHVSPTREGLPRRAYKYVPVDDHVKGSRKRVAPLARKRKWAVVRSKLVSGVDSRLRRYVADKAIAAAIA